MIHANLLPLCGSNLSRMSNMQKPFLFCCANVKGCGSRGAGVRRPGGIAPPDFARSVFHISTRECQIMPTTLLMDFLMSMNYYMSPPGFSYLSTALCCNVEIVKRVLGGSNEFFVFKFYALEYFSIQE